MRGHIQQRGKNSWRISVYLGRDANGSKRYLRRTVQGTKREAEREVSRVVVEVDEGRHVATEALTVHQLLDRWLEVKALAVEQSTLASYEWIARTYVRPALGDRNVGSLRPIDLDLLYADLAARGLSNRTVRICHTVLRQSLEQARRWGFIARSPAVDASPPPQRRAEVTPPTPAEVLTLLDGAFGEDPAFGSYLWLLAATGCRRGEACALRWSDLDLERGEVAIRRSISLVAGELREKDTKTHQSRRMAIDKGTVGVLRTHRLHQRELALALGVGVADDAFVFGDAEGGPWRPDVCTNRFGRLRARLELDRVRLHDLRHFVASVLVDGGVPIGTVSTRLGHSQLSTTLDLYTHAIPATDQRAAAYLGSLLAGEQRPIVADRWPR
ncbi:MAG: site-specific integrase [Microthrixaceae bacterium]|nr:site-specific integrase [Microthrixaceae bacterium]